jgi:hypothetical protein
LAPTYIDSCIANLERDKNKYSLYRRWIFWRKKGKWNLPNFSIPNFLEANVFQFQLWYETKSLKSRWFWWKLRIHRRLGPGSESFKKWEAYIKSINHCSFTEKDKKALLRTIVKIGQQSTIYIYKNYSFFCCKRLWYWNPNTIKRQQRSIKKILQCLVQKTIL